MGLNRNMMGGGSIFRASSLYPQCKIFHCTRSRGVKMECCFYCDRREECGDPCRNNPDACGMCVVPPGWEGETEEGMTMLGSADLPDPPDIERAERTGLRPGETARDDDGIECPICGKLAEKFYFDCDGTLFGCDVCVTQKWAEDYTPEQ